MTEFFMLLCALIFGLAGGYVYRMRGGYGLSLPRPIEQMIFAVIICAPALFHSGFWLFLAAVAVSTVACLMGHGSYMDLTRGNIAQPGDDEKVGYLMRFFKGGEVGSYPYEFLALGITGLLVTAPAGVAAGSLTLALSGLFAKPLMYELGWTIKETSSGRIRAFLEKCPLLVDAKGQFSATALGEVGFGLIPAAIAGILFALETVL